ncbi:MAG: 16S rRNA (cytidine(1402)-2'-O)-methyltransferase [Alphaproteobacteria bacterium]|nr:16S rRNA (cytidine(1402)-2'-O)-methyltransferase [Alphaproteobacteria bacterium]
MKTSKFVIGGHGFEAPAPAPGLYVVATPIGNLADISVRALNILAGVDLILCEDTRTSRKLLSHYEIKTPCRAFHEHNETAAAPALLSQISGGSSMALITDAGTPLLSDPGFVLVRQAGEMDISVVPIPGASALLAGLSVAGLPTNRFTFCGFAPPKLVARTKWLAELSARPETLIFYESPRRLAAFLTALAEQFGAGRHAVIGRELTKRFETIYRGSVGDLATNFKGQGVRGELVVLVSGKPVTPVPAQQWLDALAEALPEMALSEAVTQTARRFGVRRAQVYSAALKMRDAEK